MLLTTVAVMAGIPGASHKPVPITGPAKGPAGLGCGVTRYVCAHCTVTGQLSSAGLFLNRGAVLRHIVAAKHCHEADMGIREIQVEAQAGDVMACAGGAARPAPDVRHQPPGDKPQQCLQTSTIKFKQYHTAIYWYILVCTGMYWYKTNCKRSITIGFEPMTSCILSPWSNRCAMSVKSSVVWSVF